MKFAVKVSIHLFLIISLVSCQQEKAISEEAKELIIVSDYLNESDTLLFANFCDQQGVRIRIVNMTTDNIIGRFRNKGYNSGFDVVMLESLYSINQLSKHDFLHPADQYLSETELKENFNSSRYNYIGTGVRPYIFAHDKDTPVSHRTYSDLRNKDFYCTLSDKELIPFFASLMPKLKRSGTYNWMRDIFENQKIFNPSDSINNLPCLTTTSLHFEMSEDTSYTKRFNDFYVPGQNGEGAFYDMSTAAIVYQAEHFELADTFIHFLLEEKNNTKLNVAKGNIPLFSSKETRLYRVKAESLLQYYATVDRIINKLR